MRVVECADGIMDRAWPDDDQQPVVAPGEDVFHGFAAGLHGARGLVADGQLFLEDGGGDQPLGGNDPEIVERNHKEKQKTARCRGKIFVLCCERFREKAV